MQKTFLHEISQPLTAISNFAAATRILAEQKTATSSTFTSEEMAKVILWMEQISQQTSRINDLLRERKAVE